MRIFLSILIAVFLCFSACSNSSETSEKKDDQVAEDSENVKDEVNDQDDVDTNEEVVESTDETVDEDVDDAPPLEVIEFDDPDSQYTSSPVALIVTSEEMKSVFEDIASLHSFYGVPTVVTTVEKICETAICGPPACVVG